MPGPYSRAYRPWEAIPAKGWVIRVTTFGKMTPPDKV